MLTITTIGAFPKPPHVPVSDWFDRHGDEYAAAYDEELRDAGDDAEPRFVEATHAVVRDQVDAGIERARSPAGGATRGRARPRARVPRS